MKFEIVVGQVWEDEDGEQATVAYVTSKEVCGVYQDEGMYVWTHADHLEAHKLVKHQDGADIDTEKYDYRWLIGGRGDCVWSGSEWYELSTISHYTHLTRTPKVKELPYVDCEVTEVSQRLVWGLNELSLTYAMNEPKFIGYVYGAVVFMSPRIYAGENKPSEIPTHVRFAR